MTSYRGLPACECLAAWLPAYERELQRRGVLIGPLRIYQLIGGAEASAGTHSQGGAFDISDLTSPLDVWVARQMGADATWARTPAQGFTAHLHGVLTGCPHNSPARYQIDAVRAGYNGLGRGGFGGRDDGPRPLSGRTWREGIQWAKEQENPNMALLADLDAARKKHGASRIKAARVLLRAVKETAGPVRRTRIRAALLALKEIGS